MDTKTLITQAKARFNHNSAKAYLEEKYTAMLIVAEQGGLWRADAQTITLLQVITSDEFVVLIDTFGNPVKVNRPQLLDKLKTLYTDVMEQYYNEWKEVENNR